MKIKIVQSVVAAVAVLSLIPASIYVQEANDRAWQERIEAERRKHQPTTTEIII